MVYHDIRADFIRRANAGKETPALTYTTEAEAWLVYHFSQCC